MNKIQSKDQMGERERKGMVKEVNLNGYISSLLLTLFIEMSKKIIS